MPRVARARELRPWRATGATELPCPSSTLQPPRPCHHTHGAGGVREGRCRHGWRARRAVLKITKARTRARRPRLTPGCLSAVIAREQLAAFGRAHYLYDAGAVWLRVDRPVRAGQRCGCAGRIRSGSYPRPHCPQGHGAGGICAGIACSLIFAKHAVNSGPQEIGFLTPRVKGLFVPGIPLVVSFDVAGSEDRTEHAENG